MSGFFVCIWVWMFENSKEKIISYFAVWYLVINTNAIGNNNEILLC